MAKGDPATGKGDLSMPKADPVMTKADLSLVKGDEAQRIRTKPRKKDIQAHQERFEHVNGKSGRSKGRYERSDGRYGRSNGGGGWVCLD